MGNLSPLPTDAPLLELGLDGKQTPYLSTDWYKALYERDTRLQAASPVLGTPTNISAQSASVGTSSLTLPALSRGIYRISWYVRITQAATVSSSLTVTIGWTETAITLTASGAAITGNTVTTTQSGSLLLVTDPSAPITYATTYVSVGATPMIYRLAVACELVQQLAA